jgi:hypothetical protein
MSEGTKVLIGVAMFVAWLVFRLLSGRCPECGSSSVCDDDCGTGDRRG